MKLIHSLLFLSIPLQLPLSAVAADAPPIVWSNQYDFGVFTTCPQTQIGPDGGIYTFGGASMLAGHELGIWKHSPGGALLWKYGPQTSAGLMYFASGTLDSSGAAYAAGSNQNGAVIVKLDASGREVWLKQVNGSGVDFKISATGEMYFCGTSKGANGYDLAVSKFSSGGELLWIRSYDGPSHGDDGCSALAITADGGVVVAGWTAETGSGKKLLTIRYNSTGVAQWVRIYDGPGGTVSKAGITIDAAGNVTTGGYSGKGVIVVRYDAAGNKIWDYPYTDNLGDGFIVTGTRFKGLAADGNGNIGIIASTNYYKYSGDRPPPPRYVETLRTLSAEGQLIHRIALSDVVDDLAADQGLYTVIGLPSGGFIAGGGSNQASRQLLATNPDGTLLWTAQDANTPQQYAGGRRIMSLAVDNSGNIYTAAARHDNHGTIIISRRGSADPAMPGAITDAADDSAWNRARLNGTIAPRGMAAKWYFEYGLTTTYGQRTPEVSVAAVIEDIPVSTAITGLTGGTSYHFRLAAVSASGTAYGEDRTFTTPLSAYQHWAAQKFGSHTAAAGGPGDDFDRDGIINQLEYAFLGNPTEPGAVSGLPVPEWYFSPTSGISYLAMVWEQNPGATDLLFVPEGSGNLQQWTSPAPGQSHISVESIGGNRHRAIGLAFQKYLRLRISPAP